MQRGDQLYVDLNAPGKKQNRGEEKRKKNQKQNDENRREGKKKSKQLLSGAEV
jgi:hypothetical protein